MTAWHAEAVRRDFPILGRTVHGMPLVYLDSAATSQKPTSVIEAESEFYMRHNAAAHRGAHALAEEATEAYETARATMAGFVGAEPGDVIFTRSATDSINLVAYALLNASLYAARGLPADPRLVIREGDNIVVTQLEHHANLIPWQELCKKTGAQLRWVPVRADGSLAVECLDSLVDERTRVIAWTHVSNVLGHEVSAVPFADAAARVGALSVLDACQSVPHMPVNLPALGVDLAVWSAHKMLGPTGMGFLYGRAEVFDAMPVVGTGGSMIATVAMEESTYLGAPAKFEPGVPAMAQAVASAEAARYLGNLGMEAVREHVQGLSRLTVRLLADIPGVHVVSSPDGEQVSAVSFTVDGIHPHDVGQVLDSRGIAVRVGHHCAWPLMKALGVQSTVRASFSVYSRDDDVLQLAAGVRACQEFFAATSSARTR